MPRASAASQIEIGFVTPNTASKLIGCSSNTIRSWVRKGYVQKMAMPFSSELRLSAFELLMGAVKFNLQLNVELFIAAGKFTERYCPEYTEFVDSLKTQFSLNESRLRKHYDELCVINKGDLHESAKRCTPTFYGR